jgi:hypothetical protein
LTYALKHWPRWQSYLLNRIVELEAYVRGRWAKRRADKSAEQSFDMLPLIARCFRSGREGDARRLLRHIVRSEERQRAG